MATPKWDDTEPLFEETTAFEGPAVSGMPVLNPTQEGDRGRSFFTGPVLPIAGGILGGITGGPPGAALGGAGGEAWRQLGARQFGFEAPETALEAAKDIGIEGATQLAGEAIGPLARLGGKGIMKIPYVGEGLRAVGRGVKKVGIDLFQIITKIKPEDAATLFKNPKAILPGEWTKAQKAWRGAAEKAGIPVDDVTPEIINALKKDARSTVFDTFEKLRAGEAVSAVEAQTAKQAIDIALMPAARTERNKPLIAMYQKVRQKFVERIGKESPDLAAANKQYGVAKAGKRFRSLFPRNLDDSPAYFRSSVLPSVLLGAGYGRGEPIEGAMQGAALTALTSPLAIGSGIALAGGGRALLPYLRRAGTASLAELLADEFEGQ